LVVAKRGGKASPLFVQGIGHTTAIHLARNYAESANELRSGSSSLPGYNLRQITEWMDSVQP
jgi:hypothetical protein